MELILFSLSLLPVILIGIYVYKKDSDKEPLNLLLKLILGGILSTILALIITSVLDLIFPFFTLESRDLNLFELLIYVFIGVALVEEFSKWIFVYKISYNDKEFDQIYDMIIYAVFVALGFAGLENLLYVYNYGISTAITRALLAVPGHACDGVFMGYYLGLAKISEINNRIDLSKKYKLYSLIVPMILHGIYDYCIFSEVIILILAFYIFVLILFIFSIKKVNKLSGLKTKFIYKDRYCPNCGYIIDSDFCPNCGRQNK